MENVIELRQQVKPTKLFTKYLRVLNNTTLTESEIIALKSRIGHNSCSLTQDEVSQLEDVLLYGYCKEYDITNDHSDKGINYLNAKLFTNKGTQRNTKQVQNSSRELFEYTKTFSHFKFVGFDEVDYNQYSGRSAYMPVWRLYSTCGQYVDYMMSNNLEFITL